MGTILCTVCFNIVWDVFCFSKATLICQKQCLLNTIMMSQGQLFMIFSTENKSLLPLCLLSALSLRHPHCHCCLFLKTTPFLPQAEPRPVWVEGEIQGSLGITSSFAEGMTLWMWMDACSITSTSSFIWPVSAYHLSLQTPQPSPMSLLIIWPWGVHLFLTSLHPIPLTVLFLGIAALTSGCIHLSVDAEFRLGSF